MINGTINIAQYVIGGAVIFVLIALMGSLIVLSIMKKRGDEEPYDPVEDSKEGILESLISKMTYCESGEEDEEEEVKKEQPKKEQLKEKQVKKEPIKRDISKKQLIFTKMVNGQVAESFRGILEESLSIGRGRDKNDWVITNDQTISQKHCKMYIEQGRIYVIDLNTTNGTYVNSKRIDKPVVINDQDIIRMGASEYRITIS